ncbi:MAG: hypothetical protein K6F88_07255 [Ruminococcus sp.]|nr:hypothetical protein [Ruminococcus sp.]
MKKFDTASKGKYITPTISIEELMRFDVLLASAADNGSIDANDLGREVPRDLMDEIFGS